MKNNRAIFIPVIVMMLALMACNLQQAGAPGTTTAAQTDVTLLQITPNTATATQPPLAATDTATTTPATNTPVAASTIQPNAGTATSGAIMPVPASAIKIEGVAYKAYQIPGDTFRFVCQEPCKLDQQYIFAEYAGFRLAHPMLIKLTGIDTLSELQPVDMHLVIDDSVCRELLGGHAGMYPDTRKAYTCTDGPGYYPTIQEKIQKAAQPGEQYFTLHEYMHTIFFGRISGKAGNFEDHYAEFFHDYVVPVPSFALGIMDPAGFCSYRNQIPVRGDYPQWLISELCKQNGFQLKDVALSLIALDKLTQSGGGKVELGFTHPVPTVAQYRDILNQLLGGDTTQAFADACWPPALFGNSFSVPAVCPSQAIGGTPTPIK